MKNKHLNCSGKNGEKSWWFHHLCFYQRERESPRIIVIQKDFFLNANITDTQIHVIIHAHTSTN